MLNQVQHDGCGGSAGLECPSLIDAAAALGDKRKK